MASREPSKKIYPAIPPLRGGVGDRTHSNFIDNPLPLLERVRCSFDERSRCIDCSTAPLIPSVS